MPSMLIYIVLTLALLCKELKASPSHPKKDISFRIFNGTDAKDGEFKSMVYLVVTAYKVTKDIQDEQTKWEKKTGEPGICSGIILSPSFVMTASHCARAYILLSDTLQPPYVPALHIVIEANSTNTHGWFKRTQTRIATHKDVYYHPSSRDLYKVEDTCQRKNVTVCTPYMTMHDIAVIKINKPFDFSKGVGSVAILKGGLPRNTFLTDAITVGYGYHEPGNVNSGGVLRHGKATAGGDDYCERLLHVQGKKWQDKVCALGLNRTGTCPGDSGGPIIYRKGSQEVALGIICGGFPTDGKTYSQLECGSREGSVDFYTSTSGVEEWVKKVTKGSSEIKYVTWKEINN